MVYVPQHPTALLLYSGGGCHLVPHSFITPQSLGRGRRSRPEMNDVSSLKVFFTGIIIHEWKYETETEVTG